MTTLKDAKVFALHLERDRSARELEWRELARWLAPHRGMFTGEDDRMYSTRRNRFAFLSIPMKAIQRGAAGITSGMTPRNADWFSLEFQDRHLSEVTGARAWLDRVYQLMLIALNDGGYYQAIHQCNVDLLWSGNFLLYTEKSSLTPIHFESVQVGSYSVAVNEYGQLDAVVRTSLWTPARIAATFGKEKMTEATRKALKDEPYKRIRIYQLVRRREVRDYQKITKENMPFESLFWEEAGKDFLHVGGYEEMPFFFTTWNVGRNQYGTGPGDDAVFDAQELDELEIRKLDGLSKMSDPPVQAPHHLKGNINLSPNAINFVGASVGDSTITPILDMRPMASAIEFLQNEIKVVGDRLNDTLQASIFMSMPLEQRPAGMTATEFMERKQEALQQLGPVMASYEPNVLTPMLQRVLLTLDRGGLLPLPPESLKDFNLATQTTFISPIANALRQTDIQAMTAFMQTAMQLAQVDPQAIDKLDIDQLLDELGSSLGVPGGIIRSDEDVQNIRNQQAQMQQQQQIQQQAQSFMQNANGLTQAMQNMQNMQNTNDPSVEK